MNDVLAGRDEHQVFIEQKNISKLHNRSRHDHYYEAIYIARDPH